MRFQNSSPHFLVVGAHQWVVGGVEQYLGYYGGNGGKVPNPGLDRLFEGLGGVHAGEN